MILKPSLQTASSLFAWLKSTFGLSEFKILQKTQNKRAGEIRRLQASGWACQPPPNVGRLAEPPGQAWAEALLQAPLLAVPGTACSQRPMGSPPAQPRSQSVSTSPLEASRSSRPYLGHKNPRLLRKRKSPCVLLSTQPAIFYPPGASPCWRRQPCIAEYTQQLRKE